MATDDLNYRRDLFRDEVENVAGEGIGAWAPDPPRNQAAECHMVEP